MIFESPNTADSRPLLTVNSSTNYQSFNNFSYDSDGRSVSSRDTIENKFRLISPDFHNDEDEDDFFNVETTTSKEIMFVLRNSVPITLTFLMEYSLTIVSLFIIGHMCSSNDLASASLAVMTFNITGVAIVEGIAAVLDTFCSQAYGAQKYTKVGLYFMRCSAMIMAAAIPIVLLWWFSSAWLCYFIPEYDLLPYVQSYLRILSLGLPGLIFFETAKRFLNTQGYYEASTYSLVVTFPINVLLVTVFTKTWGFLGAPLGIAISYWIMPSCLMVYCIWVKPETLKCWYPVTESWFHFKRIFSHWKPMWNLAFHSLLMIESEYLSFEVLTIMSTYFGVDAIAAQSVVANLGSLIYQIPFAIGCVVSTRIANYIGMKSVGDAQVAIKAAYWISVIIGVVNCLIILLGNKQLARLFTEHENIIEIAHQISPILAVNQLYDSITTLGAAILRGQGRQSIGGILNIVVYYFIALPLSGWLAFGYWNLNLSGLWYGCGVGIFILAVSFSWFIYKSDWESIVDDFLKREANEYEIDLDSVTSRDV